MAAIKEGRKGEWDKKFCRIHLGTYRAVFFLLLSPCITQQAFDTSLKQAFPLRIISGKLCIEVSLNP